MLPNNPNLKKIITYYIRKKKLSKTCFENMQTKTKKKFMFIYSCAEEPKQILKQKQTFFFDIYKTKKIILIV